MKLISFTGAAAALLALSNNALAQELSAEASAEADTDGASADTELQEEVALEESEPEPAPEPEPAAAEPAEATETSPAEETGPTGPSDHEQMIGRLGVGYLGTNNVLVGVGGASITAPVVGVRYWLDPMIGIDAGLGFNATSGKITSTGNDDIDKAGATAFLLHVGVPLSLAHEGHFSFQVVPEATLGFASTGDTNPADNIEDKDSGFMLSVGARAGAELHFGFMDIPQLSLQGSLGLYLQTQSGSNTVVDDAGTNKTSDSTTAIGTTLGPDPWDIFTSNITAMYYF